MRIYFFKRGTEDWEGGVLITAPNEAQSIVHARKLVQAGDDKLDSENPLDYSPTTESEAVVLYNDLAR